MHLNVEEQVVLDRFQPRPYQAEIWDAIENKGYRKCLVILARRSGKDITCWNLAIRQCLKKVCTIYYCLPTYSQAKKAIWDSITIDGLKFLDFIPKSLIANINSQEMKIRFINGSILQCIGADSFNTSIVGTNPYGVVLSEFALMSSEVYSYVRPILAANGGWIIANSTPRGKNHLWHLYNVAKELPDWHVIKKGVSETNHVPYDVLMQEKATMEEGLYQQEWEVSFERGHVGGYYSNQLDKMKEDGRLTHVPHEPQLLVHTSWDIGINDATSIIFFNVVANGNMIRIFDYYTSNDQGVDHYAQILQEKGYRYGEHYAPFDIKVREWGNGGITRLHMAQELGIDFNVLRQHSLQDGIQNVMVNFPKLWIDERKCRQLVDSLENYRRKWDEDLKQYDVKPAKGWPNHGADALRYLCQSIPLLTINDTSHNLEQARYQALYGGNAPLPGIFGHNQRESFRRKI
jgi:phage terminase large subunit